MDITIAKAKDHIGSEVTISGWLYNKRSSGKIHFLQLRDGTELMQAVASIGDVGEELFETITGINQEASIKATGTLVEDTRSPIGVEMHLKNIEVLQNPGEDYPISHKEHGPDFLLNNRHLWLRSKKQWAIQRIRNTVIYATYEYLENQDFIKIDAPIFTPTSCEDTTELFEVDYFGDSQYLSQSGQLYIEAAIFAHRRVFDFGPVFRSEKSKTRRHLTEFWMMDAEMAFAGHEENMKVQEGLLCHIVEKVLERNEAELKVLERDVEALKKITPPFTRMTHAEAVAKLQELGSSITEGEDLGAEDEALLTKDAEKPIFIEKYPFKVKAFYMKKDPENPELALCNDLLAPEGYGEIIGGSQREDDYEELLKELRDHNLSEEDFSWYLDLRKYGSVPHSGFGYGLERIVAWISGIHHVREAIPFPRTIYRTKP